MNQDFKINIKGHIKCILKNNITGETKETEQDNLFFDQGLKNIIAAKTTFYMSLSDSIINPLITDESINSNILESVVPSRTYTSNDLTHLFTATFLAPSVDRTINTIGIAYNINGHLPWCGLKLVSPIVQTTTETLYIYYKVTIIKPSIGGSLTESGFNYFAQNLFSNPFRNSNFVYFCMSQNKIIDSEININTLTNNKKININANANIYNNFSRYFKDKLIGSSGDLTLDSGIWNSSYYGDNNAVNNLSDIDFGQNFTANIIGRVWPKLKTATGDFFESASLPNGYGRAVHVKTLDDPFLPQGEQKFSIEIESNGDVGTGTYSIKIPHYLETFFINPSAQYMYPNKYIPYTDTAGDPYFIFLSNDGDDSSCIYKMNSNPISFIKRLNPIDVGEFVNGAVTSNGSTFYGIDSLDNTNIKLIDLTSDPVSVSSSFTSPITPLYISVRGNGNLIVADANNIYELDGIDGTTITNTVLTNPITPYSFLYDSVSDAIFYTSGTNAVKFPMTTLTETLYDCLVTLIDGSPAVAASIGIFGNNLYVIKSDGVVGTIPVSTFNSLTDVTHTWQATPNMGIITVGDNLINITTNNTNTTRFNYQYSQLNLSRDGLNFNTITDYRKGQLGYAYDKKSYVTFTQTGTLITVTAEQGNGSTSIYSLGYGIFFTNVIPEQWGWTGTTWEHYNTGTKLSHTTWDNIPYPSDSTSNLQIRFYTDVGAPTNTLQNTDKYEFFVSSGLIKDNQQYIDGVSYFFYLCNLTQITNEEITMTNQVMELPSKTANSNFLEADIDNEYEIFIKDSLGGSYTYWQSPVISNLNLSVVVSHDAVTSVFETDTSGVSNYFEYYKDMWVNCTAGANIGERQKVLSYDWYSKEFTTNAFTNTPLVGDTFLIENPQSATKATSLNVSTPAMLSNTTPSGIVAASSSYASYYDWEAFNQTTSYWQTNTGWPQWISYDFEIGNEIDLLFYEIEIDSLLYAPRSWILEGSNDGTSWSQVHQISNLQVLTSYTKLQFPVMNSTLYRIYKFTFGSGYHATTLSIREIGLYSYSNLITNTNEFEIKYGNMIVSPTDSGKIIDGTYYMLTR